MKRTVIVAIIVAAAALGSASLYVNLARDAEYRRLIREGEAALGRDQAFRAIEAFSGALALRPNSMLAYLRRGESYRRQGELHAALRDITRASEIDPTALRPLEEIGDLSLALEKYQAAAASYERYLALNDRSPVMLYKLALARLRHGNAAGAIEPARQAIAQNDRFAEGFYILGVCQSELGQNGQAVQSFEQAVVLAPAMVPAREELARLLADMKRDSEAIAQLEALAALEPNESDHLIEAALLHGKRGRTDLALAELARAADRDPQPRVYQARGAVWLDAAESSGDRVALNKAIEALDRGVRGPGATSEGLTLYAHALMMRGDLTTAQQMLEDAIDKEPVDPTAYREMAVLAERRGDLSTTRDALTRFIAIAPDTEQSRSRALDVLNRALRRWPADGALLALKERVGSR